MSTQDTYFPRPTPSPMDQLNPAEVRLQREAELVYDEIGIPEVYPDIFGDERMSPSKPKNNPSGASETA